MYTYIIYKYVNLLYNTYHISVYIPYNIYNIYYMEYIYIYTKIHTLYSIQKSTNSQSETRCGIWDHKSFQK